MALIITCSEKYLNDHSDGGDYMDHCPSEYGYLDDPEECDGGRVRDICARCWNRIVPETKTYDPVVEAYKLLVNFCHHGIKVDFNKVIRYLGEALETRSSESLVKAYTLMVDFHHHGKTTDLEEVIGYLGEALDDECIYIDKPWPKENPHISEEVKKAGEELRKAYEAIRNGAKVVDIREENGGVTAVIESVKKSNPVEDLKKVATVATFAGAAFDNMANAATKFLNDTLKQPLPTDIPTYPLTSEEKESLDKMRGVPQILDSGDRTQFESGAVRDMREGKGRCDLMPLEVVADLLPCVNEDFESDRDPMLHDIAVFQETNDTSWLMAALFNFAIYAYNKSMSTMLLEVAKHFEEGAKKYGENNWQKGIPVHCYIDSAVRHYLKWLRGDKDEPHDRAFVWNLMCCIWEVDYHEKEKKDETN